MEEDIKLEKTKKPKPKKDGTLVYAILSPIFTVLSLISLVFVGIMGFLSIFALKDLYSIWLILWIAFAIMSLIFTVLSFYSYAKQKEKTSKHKTAYIITATSTVLLFPYLIIIIGLLL